MKRILTAHITWCLIIIFGLTIGSCSQITRYETPNGTSDKFRIGLSQCSDDAWRQKMDEEMQRELLFHPDLNLTIRSAADNSELQSLQIDSFIQEKVDLLIVSPNEADGLTEAVSRAYDAGIPVIVADRRVHGDKYTAFIGGDNYQVGKLLAQYARRMMPNGGNILLLRGLQGSTPDVLRYEGLTDGLEGSNIHITQEIRADWFEQNAYDSIGAQSARLSNTSMLISFNDRMAIGAWRAYNDKNIPAPIIVGVDALSGKDGGVEAVADGKLAASVSYATAGDLLIQTAALILAGEPFQRDTVIPTVLIDHDAAEPMMILSREIDGEIQTISMLRRHIDLYTAQLRQERIIIALVVSLALLALIFLFYYLRLSRKNKRQAKELQVQAEQLKEQTYELQAQAEELRQAHANLEQATLSKLTFFTNVSHDFRTPLTLIADPVNTLADDRSLTAEQHTLARLAQKNAHVLLRLINQTLDLRKYESGMLRLNLSRVDMRAAMAEWVEAFQPLAHRKHVRLMYQPILADDSQADVCFAAIDVEKTERIVYNLLANAFRFTQQNGEIVVRLWQEAENIVFSVSDTGCGIPEEHKKHIFESFYQVDTTNRQGSGIGLTLVRSFVMLQGGEINISNNEPTGTCFTVSLPIGNPDEVQFTVGEGGYVNITSSQILTELDEPTESLLPQEQAQKEHILLCIDDNADIRHYLRRLFEKDYTVFTAKNGTEGISRAVQVVPDIIICDISMPDVDGLEVCRRLKTDSITSHIPVLMLTAHSLDDKRIEGFKNGADAYMAKPFNAEVLKAQVKALRENRKRVREALSQTALMGIVANVSNRSIVANTSEHLKGNEQKLQSAEEEFLQKFHHLVMQNIANEQLSVETIASEMAMSRTQLYRKIKALTNFSPNELIRNTRLEEARRMLKKGGISVSEVAYSTGFTSPSYFTKCYSDYFGSLPSEV